MDMTDVCRYLLLPEDSACHGAECSYPKPLRACKALLWIGLSVLAGLGLDRLC